VPRTGSSVENFTTMRFPVHAVLLLIPALAAAEADFNGAWVASLCPKDVPRESGQCSNFVLELHQKGDMLCGAHFFATAGAARVDEGAAPSLIGTVANGVASAEVVSGRASPPVRVQVEMKMANGVLQWQRLENPQGDFLMPLSARLSRSRSRTLFAPVFEQELRAACQSAFTVATERMAAPTKR
jgi:hypothetical protein